MTKLLWKPENPMAGDLGLLGEAVGRAAVGLERSKDRRVTRQGKDSGGAALSTRRTPLNFFDQTEHPYSQGLSHISADK